MPRKQVLRIIIGILAIMALTLILGSSAWAAEFKTLHKFKQTGVRGYAPDGSLTFDAAGNLYGTTAGGGAFGWGTVFELTPNPDGSWVESVRHSFNGSDGGGPAGGLIFDAAGNLYGTTEYGGGGASACDGYGCGAVFKLTPNGDGSWVESVLHSFDGSDGQYPAGGLIFDGAGNLYGTTYMGGKGACLRYCGIVFKLTPNGDGSWVYSVLHTFNGSDGEYPWGGLIFDAAGNLYGTTAGGGAQNRGAVFQLTPNGDGSWTESVLYSFKRKDGVGPSGGLTFDAAGNLYGTTWEGGAHAWGTVFELTPNGDGSWVESVLHSFNRFGLGGFYPQGGLTFDAAGNLYGTTFYGGAYDYGVVFKLKPTPDDAWRYHVIHQFMDRPGAYPYGGLVLDQTGNLYGTTRGDGETTFGSAFEITP